jgi:GNAT superfamily N-acetyltransferase
MNPTTTPAQATIRPAAPADVPGIHDLLLELAEYERLVHAVQATPDSLREALFGPHPAAAAMVAETEGQLIGYALYFVTYSTFVGRPGIYLEDLYVQPRARGRGIGRQLLEAVARVAVERKCGRLEWTVLDWNRPSIDFYERLGAEAMAAWKLYRLTGAALAALGGSPGG